MAYAYSTAAWVAVYTAVLDQLKGGTGSAQAAVFVDATDAVLASVPLDLEASAVSEAGTLTIVIDGSPPNATDTGTAAKLVLTNTDGDPVTEMDCKVGTVAESGYCVLNTLSIVSGMPVDLQSLTIPPGGVIS